MSKNNQMILISPPMFIGEGNRKESISSKGHRCSHCHGNGFFWGEEQRERVKIERFNGKSSYDNVRMDDGFSRELDKRRIEDMGNAVIPLIAYYLFECIKKFRESI